MLSSSFSSSTFSGKKIRCVVTVVVVVVVVVIVVVDTEMPNREQIQIKSRNFSSTQKSVHLAAVESFREKGNNNKSSVTRLLSSSSATKGG